MSREKPRAIRPIESPRLFVLTGFAQKVPVSGEISHADPQSAAASLKVFFAPLRERNFLFTECAKGFQYFLRKAFATYDTAATLDAYKPAARGSGV